MQALGMRFGAHSTPHQLQRPCTSCRFDGQPGGHGSVAHQHRRLRANVLFDAGSDKERRESSRMEAGAGAGGGRKESV